MSRNRDEKRKEWDKELAKIADREQEAWRDHEARYQTVYDALRAIGIDPRELQEFLRTMPD